MLSLSIRENRSTGPLASIVLIRPLCHNAPIATVDTLEAVPTGLRRLILWDYQRGVWQYDVICAVIVLFIFFSPRDWFRDQPRIPNAARITSLPAQPGESEFWIDTELVTAIPEEKRLVEIGKILTNRTGKRRVMTRIEPLYDAEREVKGYMAFSKP